MIKPGRRDINPVQVCLPLVYHLERNDLDVMLTGEVVKQAGNGIGYYRYAHALIPCFLLPCKPEIRAYAINEIIQVKIKSVNIEICHCETRSQ
jgi:hypothetical protein